MPELKPRPETEQLLDLSENASPEELENRVQKAQEQLIVLKRQQDAIEKQKRELEELSQRQVEFEKGKAEMLEKITRSLALLEREIFETQRRAELLQSIDSSFRKHIQALEGLNPKNWNRVEIGRELSRALSCVDDARADFNKSRSKILAAAERDDAALELSDDTEASHDFVYWLKSGFAFTLPLLLLGVAGLVVFAFRIAAQ